MTTFTKLTDHSNNGVMMHGMFDNLRQGSWGTCPMSVMIPGSRSIGDCVKAGWPMWLVDIIIRIFDENTVDDGRKFAVNVAKAIDNEIDLDKAYEYILQDQINKYTNIENNDRLKTGVLKNAVYDGMTINSRRIVKASIKDQGKNIVENLKKARKK